jgi:head-tail adaptor
MSIERRFVHRLLIQRATSGAEDSYGQPSRTWSTLATVDGLVAVKSAREVALLSQGGAEVSDFTIFVLPTDVTAADRVRLVPFDGRVFEITGIRDPAPTGHHLELDARAISPAAETVLIPAIAKTAVLYAPGVTGGA